ncbi:MAG: 50S ribosomal protein L24 [Cyclobacteriaceae bacterium]|jgi:large subunit ribosomal protein L24
MAGQVKIKVKKGDTVKVIAGNDKGKSGKVLEIIKAKSRVIVEGVNIVTKHKKPSAENPEGGIDNTEAGIHISNVMVVDPASGDASRVGRKADDNGKMKRYSKKTGDFITNG